MSLRISGMGWVTPLGSGVTTVWERLLEQEQPTAEPITSSINQRSYRAFRVRAAALAAAPAHPRLRRSSAISRFAVVAGLAALDDAGVQLDAASAGRTAVIFAVSNGGVVYTKRFYHEVVESGAQAASPLLFPETVFNAPASHLAAILGITGATYTLVGDGAVGLLAIKMAEDLMLNPELDRCLVVGSEETDWLLCDAYARWRLLREAPPIEPFSHPARGTILSEGAGALLLGRTGLEVIQKVEAGCNFENRRGAAECVDQILANLGASNDDVIIASANGTFIDAAEEMAVRQQCPAASVYAPKACLGESVGASGLWQVICAVQALRARQLPTRSTTAAAPSFRRAIVSTCGLNQQVAGLAVARSH